MGHNHEKKQGFKNTSYICYPIKRKTEPGVVENWERGTKIVYPQLTDIKKKKKREYVKQKTLKPQECIFTSRLYLPQCCKHRP